MVTTIQLDEKTKLILDRLKAHHRESYNELLLRMAKAYSQGDDKESLTETLEVISDPEAMREIADALEAYKLGKGKTLKQLRKELEV